MKNVEDFYPLSPLQTGLLYHSIKAPESNMYFQQFSLSLRGELDQDAFERAWEEMIRRHTILRTSFVWEAAKQPLQVVHRNASLPVTRLDWTDLPLPQQQAQLDSFLEADRALGFDLSRAPLMRLALIRTSDGRYQFVWSHHHLLLDGWSVPVLLGEVLSSYEALRRGEPVRLGPVRPYRDYIVWLQRQDRAAAQRYWRNALRGIRRATPVPGAWAGAKAAGEGGVSAGGHQEQQAELSREETRRLEQAARQMQVTVNTVVQGAWAIVLSRYSGEGEVVYGGTVSGRPAEIEGVERMVGIMINTLPVVVRVRGEASVGEWLRGLQEEQVEARRYEYSALVEVQGWSDVGAGEALFESILVYENYPGTVPVRGRVANFEIESLHHFERTNYPLTVLVTPGEQLSVGIAFDEERFEASTIKRVLGYLEQVLKSMSEDPGRRVSDVEMISQHDRRQVLVEWNRTDRQFEAAGWVHDIFQQQAALRPEAVAVSFQGESLTYRQLNDRANRVANYLRGVGVGPEAIVAVCMTRSTEMVVALMGVLKAGAAYLPIDPGYPRQRVEYMLDDAGAQVVLTQHELLGTVRRQGRMALCLDTQWEEVAASGAHDPQVEVEGDNAAYVIYTSGTTGTPKGAINTHKGMLNRMLWMQHQVGLDHTDRVLQKTTFCFDVSVWEVFLPLMIGARVVLARPGGQKDGAYLWDVIGREGVTTLHFVPSMLGAFLEAGGAGAGSSLRRVVSSGEALSLELKERFFEEVEGVRLYNLYGPTEASVDVTWWECERGGGRGEVPIGRPIWNTKIYVLDGRMEPSGVGVAGEIYISGAGVGRGYHNRADMTAEMFEPDPHGGEGARMYRSGDIGRVDEEGNIEYLGRRDDQVKVRGYRIEKGEVEAALRQVRGVKDCAVEVREVSGQKQLVGYVVREDGSEVSVGEIREQVRWMLPEYMVPGVVVMIESLPVTANGKLDREGLPDPGGESAGQATQVAPRSEVERAIAEIWQEVLHLEKVGVHDNFFELGGNSILMLTLLSKIRGKYFRDISMINIFEYPTISSLAEYIGKQKGEESVVEMNQDRAETRRDSLRERRKLRQKHAG